MNKSIKTKRIVLGEGFLGEGFSNRWALFKLALAAKSWASCSYTHQHKKCSCGKKGTLIFEVEAKKR